MLFYARSGVIKIAKTALFIQFSIFFPNQKLITVFLFLDISHNAVRCDYQAMIHIAICKAT